MLNHTKHPSPTWRKSGLMVAFLLTASFLLLAVGGSAVSAQETLEVGGGKDYATIQEAIDNASPGDTVLVGPGTYTASGLVPVADIYKSNLTLKSTDGPEATIIQSEGADWCYGAIRIRGADGDTPTTGVTIDGFTVYNPGEWHHGIGILVGYWACAPAHSNIVKNCIVGSSENRLNSPSYGIYLGYTSGNLIENNTIYQARDVRGVEGSGIILWVQQPYYTNSENNTIRNNTILNSDKFGICIGGEKPLSDVSGTIVENNTIKSNGSGMLLWNASWKNENPVKINLNNIEGNTNLGISNGTTQTVDATLNWWGTTVESEIAGMVSENVDYSLWLDADGSIWLDDSEDPDDPPNPTEGWTMLTTILIFILPIVLITLALVFDSIVLAFLGGISSIFAGLYFVTLEDSAIWIGMIFIGLGIYFMLSAIFSEED